MDNATTEPLVRLEDLDKSFYRNEGEVRVLKGIDLEIRRGETVAVVGVSGAGKSTLLHILGALELPTRGRVLIDGNEINRMQARELARFRNVHLGFVFQFHHLLPEFTALENTMMPALIARIPASRAKEKAEEILTELGLADRLSHKVGELSGGEQQRVALSRAVLLEPSLILADEPTGNLDATTGKTVEDLILKLNREKNITALIVTHNEALARRMDRIIRLHDGMIQSIE
ncbi:MAG: ABC transporter ATP-binding protein [bacterium]